MVDDFLVDMWCSKDFFPTAGKCTRHVYVLCTCDGQRFESATNAVRQNTAAATKKKHGSQQTKWLW